MNLQSLYQKVYTAGRISPEEGLFILKNHQLLDLGGVANDVRHTKNPGRRGTFISDTNPNYTNICNVDCIFCAFYRHEGEEGEYTYSVDQMIDNFRKAADIGVTTILLQGGVNPKIPFEYYCEMVERTVKE